MNRIPLYEEIKEVYSWCPPQPCSLMIALIDSLDKKINIDMLPNDEGLLLLEEEEYSPPPNPHIPRRIYINQVLVELNSPEEKSVITLLYNLIRDNKLGHPQGLEVVMAQEMISHFKGTK